jgi:hypothetical protein
VGRTLLGRGAGEPVVGADRHPEGEVARLAEVVDGAVVNGAYLAGVPPTPDACPTLNRKTGVEVA